MTFSHGGLLGTSVNFIYLVVDLANGHLLPTSILCVGNGNSFLSESHVTVAQKFFRVQLHKLHLSISSFPPCLSGGGSLLVEGSQY